MSVEFICGKPGGGKSFYALQELVVPELTRGDRFIVTNLSVDRGELAEWLEKHQGETFGLLTRLVKIEDSDVRRFWEFRDDSGKRWPIDEGASKWDYTASEDSRKSPGVLYILDEVHIAFGARNWQTNGKAALFYLSQHRKLGDDVVCITQSAQNVDKQFRSVAQSFTYLKNFAKQRFGGFRLPARFVSTRYAQPAGPGVPMEATKVFALNEDLASCYDTSAGVGVVGGRKADAGRRPPGVSIAWAFVALVVLALLVYQGMAWGSRKLVGGVVKSGSGVTNAVAGLLGPLPGILGPLPAAGGATNYAVVKEDVPKAAPVGIVGMMSVRGVVCVYLSDGRVLRSDRGELDLVGQDFAVAVGGRRYGWASPSQQVVE